MIAMGFGNPNSSKEKERSPNFKYYTKMSLEMKICKEYLNKPHSYFLSLSREDKEKLRLFERWEREKDLAEQKKMESEMAVNKNRSGIK
uniref:Uncharacterized protein n=1 Tax=viral metagenome TaxID=1070528 RepID=A0A6M3IDV4_9ZZZZ